MEWDQRRVLNATLLQRFSPMGFFYPSSSGIIRNDEGEGEEMRELNALLQMMHWMIFDT